MRGAVSICTMAMALPAMAAALTAGMPNEDKAATLIPLSADPNADDAAYVQTRCRDFVQATIAVGMVLRSNPVTGRDEKRGDSVRWALEVDTVKSFPLASPMTETSFTKAYLDAFGGFDVHQPEPTATIYAQDKASCAPLLRFYE
ncbi:hypothetical protein HYQ43_10315 [Paracoccus pantotrophus]|uniref:Uncharacterized protein n=1 Tax=Paracoccus pantotrophus TaxID=82367 RepID=A0A7H9BV28_PARPN|nr:hypothetical protein HYQ43_10315 [Paracoccus pantotrophus]RDD98812.1 hypothetical protein DTW92_05160 [Paracoccus pantotrophus]RNI18893.1 hypothetical protein EB844_07590 [Paracoccus pantotrophus]WGR64823.1 hypothetical protein E3U24_05700 [Paracoccus pantotrophus]SFO15067.1 hypothetical protein SAMN04244567_00893 [Paracoccus pantotrophus]